MKTLILVGLLIVAQSQAFAAKKVEGQITISADEKLQRIDFLGGYRGVLFDVLDTEVVVEKEKHCGAHTPCSIYKNKFAGDENGVRIVAGSFFHKIESRSGDLIDLQQGRVVVKLGAGIARVIKHDLIEDNFTLKCQNKASCVLEIFPGKNSYLSIALDKKDGREGITGYATRLKVRYADYGYSDIAFTLDPNDPKEIVEVHPDLFNACVSTHKLGLNDYALGDHFPQVNIFSCNSAYQGERINLTVAGEMLLDFMQKNYFVDHNAMEVMDLPNDLASFFAKNIPNAYGVILDTEALVIERATNGKYTATLRFVNPIKL